MESQYDYVIVGGGLAGASAVQGIRELDIKGTVLLLGEEKHRPYDRPPLSKKLWFENTKIEEIFLHEADFYNRHGVTVVLGAKVIKLDPATKTVTAADGATYRFGKLLLATGGTPKRLSIPGGDLDEVCYFRTLDDYLRTRDSAVKGKSALVIGGGFIGSELAAALNTSIDVTMVFPGANLCDRVFPDYLSQALRQHYKKHGIKILSSEMPVSIHKHGEKFQTQITSGKIIESDLLLVGIGLAPSIDLAAEAGLTVGNGIEVNGYLESSCKDIYAAGDNAFFPYPALGQHMRIEHWDNALTQGKWAGRNMAGAHEPFTYQPYFFSDLFEFGYEATGEVDARLDTFADWQKENDTGVIYYLRDGKIRGVMMCNVWDKIEAARELIRRGETFKPEQLRGAISF